MAQISEPLDLRQVEQPEPSVPVGWELVADICRGMLTDAEEITDHIVEQIGAELPAYTKGSVPRSDLWTSVARNLRMMMFGLAEHRRPLPSELEVRRELGHRRAQQGLPVDSLLQAYHVGYRELWSELVNRARASGDAEVADLMLTGATTFWGWIQDVTNAVAEAHAETLRARDALAWSTRQHFIELLVTGDVSSDELRELSLSLGFDADQSFRAAVVRAASLEGAEPGRMMRELEHAHGVTVSAVRGNELLLIAQRIPATDLISAIERVMPGSPVGVGTERPGLAGARLSLVDAENALAVAERRGGVSRFQDDWLPALVLKARAQLSEQMSVGHEVARKNPHLAEAVKAFARSGFSLAEAGRVLSLHPNSVLHRIDRWHELTGWNPRTFEGLTRSVAALETMD